MPLTPQARLRQLREHTLGKMRQDVSEGKYDHLLENKTNFETRVFADSLHELYSKFGFDTRIGLKPFAPKKAERIGNALNGYGLVLKLGLCEPIGLPIPNSERASFALLRLKALKAKYRKTRDASLKPEIRKLGKLTSAQLHSYPLTGNELKDTRDKVHQFLIYPGCGKKLLEQIDWASTSLKSEATSSSGFLAHAARLLHERKGKPHIAAWLEMRKEAEQKLHQNSIAQKHSHYLEAVGEQVKRMYSQLYQKASPGVAAEKRGLLEYGLEAYSHLLTFVELYAADYALAHKIASKGEDLRKIVAIRIVTLQQKARALKPNQAEQKEVLEKEVEQLKKRKFDDNLSTGAYAHPFGFTNALREVHQTFIAPVIGKEHLELVEYVHSAAEREMRESEGTLASVAKKTFERVHPPED